MKRRKFLNRLLGAAGLAALAPWFPKRWWVESEITTTTILDLPAQAAVLNLRTREVILLKPSENPLVLLCNSPDMRRDGDNLYFWVGDDPAPMERGK